MTTQYVIVNKDGLVQERYHQDDSCDPIVAGSIEILLEDFAETLDYGEIGPVLKEMYKEGLSIRRQEVTTVELTDEDKAEFDRLAIQAEKDEEEALRVYDEGENDEDYSKEPCAQ